MFTSFQTRLVTIFVGLFSLVQLMIFLAVYQAITYNVVQQIKTQLSYASGTFSRHLAERAEKLSISTTILTADFAFRHAISEDDPATSLSVIRNLGDRIKADRVILISLAGKITADTQQKNIDNLGDFPYQKMITTVRDYDIAKEIIILNGKLYNFVIVPVLAPLPIAWVGVGFEINHALIENLRSLSLLSLDISFLKFIEKDHWNVIHTTLSPELLADLPVELLSMMTPLSATAASHENETPIIKHMAENDYVTLVIHKLTPEYSPPVKVFLQYPLEKAMRSYEPLLFWLKILSLLGLLFAVLGSMLISRSVSKPVHTLVNAANRIELGDYQQKIHLKQKDEFGRLASAFNVMMDSIAEREEKIVYQAHYDALSGLPNRIQFEKTLQKQIAMAEHENKNLTIMLIKIERLYEINNTLGHHIGDQLIIKVSERLKTIVLSGDSLAHLTRNTFIFMSIHSGINDGLDQAGNILNLFNDPCIIDEINIDVHLRIGKSFYPYHGNDSKSLIQKADVAMYSALKSGKSYAIYDSKNDNYTRDNLSLMSQMKSGLINNEFQLYYQPKVHLLNKHTTHAEALIRWNHPVKGFMPPDDFIPLAEQSGNIHQLSLWVIENAIIQCSEWKKQGINIKISVNISVKDLLVKNLPDIIMDLLNKYGLKASHLILEITESSIMEDPDIALTVLTNLQQLGLKISIDDFGTGYSSMSYLKKLPAEILKIDKSFVIELSTNNNDITLVKSMIDLAHNLNMVVVAEGVEDEGALKILEDNHCDYIQGYYISRPLPVAEFNEWLKNSIWGINKL